MKLERENHSPPQATKSFKTRASFLLKFLFPQNAFLSLFSGLLWAGLFSFVLYAFATPPTTPYDIGETLNPTCSPSDTNCTVTLPAAYSFSSSAFSGTGNFTTTGTVQAGSFTDGTLTISSGNLSTTGTGQFGSISFTTALGVGSGGTGLGSIPIGSILAANSLNTLSAITSTTGLKVLQNSAGVISWNTTTGTGDSVFATSPTITTPTIASLIGNKIYPASDSTTAIQINKADGTTTVLNINTTNGRVGIGTTSPAAKLDVSSDTFPVLQITRTRTEGNTIYGAANLELVNATPTAGNGIGFYFKAPNSAGSSRFSGLFGSRLSVITAGSEVGEVIIRAAYAGTDPGATAYPDGLVVHATSASKQDVYMPNGSVGIGTTSPGQKLEVNGNILSNGGTSTSGQVLIGQASNYPGIWFQSNASSPSTTNYAFLADYGGGGTILNAPTGNPINFRINNVSKMTVSSAGDVGIGTTTPVSKLELVQEGGSYVYPFTMSVYGSTVSAGFVGRAAGGTQASPTATPDGTSIFVIAGRGYDGSNWTTNSPAYISFKSVGDFSASNNGTYIDFWTTPTGSTGASRAERMRITSTGNVGIGTLTPSAKLDVSGSLYAAYNAGNQGFFGTTTANATYKFQFSSSTVSDTFARLVLFNADTSATAAVASPMTFKLTSSGNMADGFGPGFLYAIEDNAGVEHFIARTSAVRAGDDTTGRFNIDVANAGTLGTVATFLASGYVGIGANSPNTKLTIGTPETPVLGSTYLDRTVANYGAGGVYFLGRDTTNDIEFIFGTSVSGYAWLGTMTNHDLVFRVNNNTEAMRATKTGYVGVGTTTPNAKFEVSRAAANVVSSGSGTTTTAFLRLQNSGGGLVGDFGLQSTSPYGLWIQATNRDYLDSTYPILLNPVGGNVGIGLTVPTAALHIKAGTATANTAPLKFSAGTLLSIAEAGTIEYVSGQFVLQSDTLKTAGLISPYIAPSADSTTAFQIRKADKTTSVLNVDTTNGRVGIGTTTPAAALDVTATPTVGAGNASAIFRNNQGGGTASAVRGWTVNSGGATGIYGDLAGYDGTRWFGVRGNSETSGAPAIVGVNTSISNPIAGLFLGNVGIGTTPSYIFDVQTSAGKFSVTSYGASSAKVIGSGSLAYDVLNGSHIFMANGTTIATMSASEQLRLSYSATYYSKFIQAAAGLTITPAVNTETAFNFTNAAGLPRLNIDATNGKIGINTSAPATMLHLKGADPVARYEIYRSGGGIAADFFQLYATNATSGLSTSFGAIGFYGNLNSDPTPPSVGYIYMGADSDTSYTKNALRIYPNQIVMVTANLSVGTASSNSKVEILSTAEQLRLDFSTSAYTKFLVNSSNNLVITPAANSTSAFNFTNAAVASILNIDSTNSRVGIGNATPQTKFVIGDGFASAINGTPVAYITDNFNGISGVDMGNLSTGSAADFRFIIRDTSDHYFAFIQPSVNNAASNILGHARNTGDFIFNNAGTTRDLVIGNVSAKDLIFGTNNAENMRIKSGGTIGIGLTSPTAVLHIKAGTATAGTAPLKFSAGTLLSIAEAGTIEYTTGLFTLQSDSLTVGGSVTATTLLTGVESTSPSGACTNGSIKISSSGTTPGIYYCYGGAWHYSDQTGGFQIPKYESVDPVTGEQMQVGDFVVPMIDKVFEDGTAHGIWARWSTVKAQLLAEVGASATSTWSGAVAAGTVSGVDTTTLTTKVTNVLSTLGITISNGVTSITKLTTTNLTASVARVNKMEMVASNGDIYCTWIDDSGEWQKVKGECGSINTATATTAAATTTTTTTTTAAETTTTTETTAATEAATQQALEAAQQAAQAAAAAEAAAQSAQQAATEAASTSQTTTVTSQLNIVSISSISDINVEYGSTPTLPETIAVTLSDGITANPAVSWDQGTPTFDANTAATYVFTGTPTTTSSITNTDNLTATVNVIVAPQPATETTPAVTEESAAAAVEETVAPSVGELIQESTSSLMNGMWKFIQWIFGSTTQQVSKLIPVDVKQSTASLSSSVTNNFEAGLNQIYSDISGMIKNILKIPNSNVQ